ncbi:hypothetical protein ABPG72_001810 [Tetrahymena utriculariae]
MIKKKPNNKILNLKNKLPQEQLIHKFLKEDQYKQISFRDIEKPAPYLEDSILNYKSKKSRASDSNHFSGKNEKFKFFQGDQSIFSKEFQDSNSKFYNEQSSIFTSKELLNSAYNLASQEDEQYFQNNPKYQHIKQIDKQLEELSIHLKNPERNILINILENVYQDAKEVKDNYTLLLKILELKGKILRDIGHYQRSVNVFKQARLYCNISKNYDKKLYFYKTIVEMYMSMREYDNAIIYAKKMLRLSWIINNVDYEIISYDKLGMIKYYQGDLSLADYFHEKAFSNNREPKNSQIRKVGENIQRKNKKTYNPYVINHFETDSEDDFDLGLFQNIFLTRRSSQLLSLQESSSLPSLKQKIPVPRIVNEHIRQQYFLGRIDIPFEKKKDYINDQDSKYIYNQLSLNRNLKNFMVQQYINHGYWSGSQDQLSKIKFYHLHRHQKSIQNLINKIRNYLYSLKNIYKFENILEQQHENNIIQNPSSNNNRSSIIVNQDYQSKQHNQAHQQHNLQNSQQMIGSSILKEDSATKQKINSQILTLPRINNTSLTNLIASKTPTKNRLSTRN